MELDLIEQKRPQLNKKKLTRQPPDAPARKKKCYGCGKFNYIAKNCHSKNKIQ